MPERPPALTGVTPERFRDVGLALTFLASAWSTWSRAPGHAATWAGVALSLAVSAGFARRGPELAAAPTWAVLAALPGVVGSALVLWAVPPASAWGLPATTAFAGGLWFATAALVSLGPSFAVLPARRAVVARGPYRWVRHPAYAGEGLAVVAAATQGGPLAWGLAAAFLVALVVRIGAEERVLLADPAYRAYAARVRWRWAPGIW